MQCCGKDSCDTVVSLTAVPMECSPTWLYSPDKIIKKKIYFLHSWLLPCYGKFFFSRTIKRKPLPLRAYLHDTGPPLLEALFMLDWDLVDTALHESDTNCSNNSVQNWFASTGGSKITKIVKPILPCHILHIKMM